MIDTQCGNRLVLHTDSSVVFIKNITLNGKSKAKRLGCYIVFMFAISQPLVPCAAAVMLSLPPTIERFSPFEQNRILGNKDCYPQIASIPASKIDKIRLTNKQIKQFNNLALQLNSGSITMEEAVLELRGGGLTDVAAVLAFVIFVNWYDSLFGTEAFQANPLPHMDPMGWSSGKYDSKNAGNGQCLSHPPSRFERETLHTMKQMCDASADENGFVMNYDEAYNLIKETYGGSIQITEDCKISDWQGAKKAYHFQKGFDIDLGKYQNINKKDLISLQKTGGGLIPYVQKGGKLPPIELIRDCQQKIYDLCHLENTEINRAHMSKLNYNKQRHLELLKLKYSQEKVLTSTEKSELNEYWSLLDNTLDWETKEQYIDLLEKLISRKINSFKFYIEFKERNDSNGEVFDSLKANYLLLSPHEKSKEFSNFISEIMDFCYSYSEVFELDLPQETRDSYELEFRNFMEKTHFKIQKVLNEE